MGLRSDDNTTFNNSNGKRHKTKPIEEVATGMNSIFWGIRNPLQSGLRGFGLMCALLGSLTVLAGAIYWLRGANGNPQLSAAPGDLGPWVVENGFDPFFSPIFRGGREQLNSFDEWFYRQMPPQPQNPSYSSPEDLYRDEANTISDAVVE